MGRCAVAEGVVHGGELLLHIVFTEADKLESLDHDLRIVVPDCAGGQFDAVADQVILLGRDGQRVEFAPDGLVKRGCAAARHGERVVAEFQFAGLIADLVHREIDDPAEFVAFLIHMALDVCAEGLDEHAGKLRGRSARRNNDQRVGRQAETLGELLLAALHKLGDAAGKFAVFIHLEPVALDARLHLAVGQKLFNLLPCQMAVRDRDGLDSLALERLKFRFCEQVGEIFAGQIDAQIRFVRAVSLQRILVCDAAERCAGRDVILAVLGEDRRQHIFDDGKHIILRGEGHFHIKLIELAGAAVAARVFVAEAGSNLEIAVEAGGHKQLLELLRRLRQSVELAGMLSGGNEVVACALRAGCRENGGRDFEEIMVHHGLANGGNDVAAQDDVAFDGGVAQVEIAVFQALCFVSVAAAVDLEREFVVLAAAEQFDLLRHDFNVAGGLLGVLACAFPHGAGHGDGRFLVDALDDVHDLFRFNDDLRCAVEITQNEEGKVIADHADIFHPADERNMFACVFDAELAAGMGS